MYTLMLFMAIGIVGCIAGCIDDRRKNKGYWDDRTPVIAILILSGFVGVVVALCVSACMPRTTVVRKVSHQLVSLQGSDKLSMHASFLLVGPIGGGSASLDQKYVYVFWSENDDHSASRHTLHDGDDVVRISQDATPSTAAWVEVITEEVVDSKSRLFDWALCTSEPNELSRVHYFHVPEGTINGTFRLE